MRAIFKMAENRYQKLLIRKIAHFTSKKEETTRLCDNLQKSSKTLQRNSNRSELDEIKK